jgi:hypothetical protein
MSPTKGVQCDASQGLSEPWVRMRARRDRSGGVPVFDWAATGQCSTWQRSTGQRSTGQSSTGLIYFGWGSHR